MELVIPVNSLIVSGVSMLLFNIIFFELLRVLSQSVCSSTNLNILYDRKRPLAPRTSRVAFLFGGPVGHAPIVRALSILIAIYAIAVIPLEFSINGSTRVRYIPTKYQSIVQHHPDSKPLEVDYKNEYNITDEGTFVSQRLLAVSEIISCMVLNFSHHTNFAYAYRSTELDKKLTSIRAKIPGGECVRKENFRDEIIMHQWDQTQYDGTFCNMSKITVVLNNTKKSTVVSAKIDSPGGEDCLISFLTIKCFPMPDDKDNCVAIAEKTADPSVRFLISVPDASQPAQFERHQLRKLSNIKSEYLDTFVANVAFFQAVGFPGGVFISLYMSISMVRSDVELYRLERTNISVVNLAVSLPTIGIIIFVLGSVTCVAVYSRIKFVLLPKRKKYNQFSSVSDVLQMVRDDRFTKIRQETAEKRYIVLRENRPVLSDTGVTDSSSDLFTV